MCRRLVCQVLLHGLGNPKVDHLGHGYAVVQGDHDVGRFDVAVNNPLLMRVLDGVADGNEQIRALSRGKLLLITVFCDRNAFDQLHHEIKDDPTR